MSFSYSTWGQQVGSVGKSIYSLLATQATLFPTATLAQNISVQYYPSPQLAPNLANQFIGFSSQAAGMVSSLLSIVNNSIGDLQSFLNSPSSSPSIILPLFAQQFVIDGQTMLQSTVGSPTIALGSGDVGNGTLVAVNTDWSGVIQQQILNQVVRFQCTNDQYTGATAGAEQFSTTGYPFAQSNYAGQLGNGNGSSLSVANNSPQQLIQNGGFDTFTTNLPNNWTLVAGTAGTNVLSTLTTHSPGALALLFQGNSSAATVTITQALSPQLQTRSKYGLGIWMRKGGGTFAGGSNLKISIYSPSGAMSEVNIFNADPTTLTTSYILYSGFMNVGATFATDATARINWTGAASEATTAQIFMDDMVVIPATSFGGVAYFLERGSADFLKNDFITSTTTNDNAGLWSSFFARFYSIQFPLVASAPTFSESWI